MTNLICVLSALVSTVSQVDYNIFMYFEHVLLCIFAYFHVMFIVFFLIKYHISLFSGQSIESALKLRPHWRSL